MLKNIVTFLMIIQLLAVSLIFFTLNLEHSWFLSEDYKLYNLLYAFFTFSIFILGITRLKSMHKASLCVLSFIIFTIYQVLSWQTDSKHFTSKLAINSEVDIILIHHSGGAMASGYINLVASKSVFFLFKKNIAIKSYDAAVNGELILKDPDTIAIELSTDTKDSIHDELKITELLLSLSNR